MPALGIDTCTGACSVAVTRGDAVLASLSEPRERGHVERLAPMVAEALARAGLVPAELQRIVCVTGPGSFTGARLAVAFIRGLALACGARAAGASVFDVLAADGRTRLVAMDARRGTVFAAMCEGGAAGEAAEMTPGEAAGLAGGRSTRLAGSGAGLVAAAAPDAPWTMEPWAPLDPVAVARMPGGAAPAPLYLRPPDAKPAA